MTRGSSKTPSRQPTSGGTTMNTLSIVLFSFVFPKLRVVAVKSKCKIQNGPDTKLIRPMVTALQNAKAIE